MVSGVIGDTVVALFTPTTLAGFLFEIEPTDPTNQACSMDNRVRRNVTGLRNSVRPFNIGIEGGSTGRSAEP